MRAQYEISTRTYHVGTCLLRHSLELVVVGCTVYLDAQVQHHLSNLDHSSVAAVDAYTASVDLCYCHMHALGQPRMKLLFGFIWERSSRFGEGRQFLCYCFSSFSTKKSLIALLLLEYPTRSMWLEDPAHTSLCQCRCCNCCSAVVKQKRSAGMW